MKKVTINPSTVISRLTLFLGVMLAVIFLTAFPSMSQSSTAPVNLGTAGNYVILAKTGLSTTGTTNVTGDIGLSPAAATYITGFGLIMDPSGTFSTSSLITGNVYASDYTSPTPTRMTTAVGDMQTAYTDAAGRTSPDYSELYSGVLTGQTLLHGLYKWGTGVSIGAAGVTISGKATDIWIFQIAQNLTVANGAIVTLSGGALASNVYWQVAGQVIIGTTSEMKGIILCQTGIAMNTGATLNGRALAQTAVTLNANSVIQPATVTAVKNNLLVPEKFVLFQNYPNPFNPSTKIQYSIEKPVRVSLKVYNLLGKKVATLVNSRQEAGSYTVTFNTNKSAVSLSSGVYFYRLEAGSFVSTKKLILMK